MYAKFKLPYVGALKIYDPSENCFFCAYQTNNRRFVYFDKFHKLDTQWVDQHGVVWVDDNDGYLVEKTV